MAIWASCTDKRKRQLILGIEKPEYYKFEQIIELSDELTALQKNAILKAFFAKDYMLIWGPPGTGKTSMILKHLSKLILNYTNENTLVLAYTNKAVDEICHSLIDGGLQDHIIRIGSKINSNQNLHSVLLNHQISSFKNRNEVVEFLKTKRIFISTISSFLGKLELLDLKKFDTLIIDEASQVIEPMLCGILTLVRKFILIGDHKQLPAIVQQNHSKSVIENKSLLERGFKDMRTSLFERLYSQISHKNEYNHAYCILTEQGRMHKKIMDFVNPYFYENKLKTIKISQISEPISDFTDNTLYRTLCTERVIFINVDSISRSYKKRNEEEAICTHRVIASLINIYKLRDQKWHDETLGVITPFRAQINQIKHLVNDHKITIDTVERYQGGARDIIVMSTVINNLSQLKSIVSTSLEGIDRKLNVAITRSKNQFILIGNEEILSKSNYYKKLIDYSYKLDYENLVNP
jgi:DNA replication ATP-dependent helicase Dna2